MNLILLCLNYSDGCTYSCEVALGVFDDEVEAMTAAIAHHEKELPNYPERTLDEYMFKHVTLNHLRTGV